MGLKEGFSPQTEQKFNRDSALLRINYLRITFLLFAFFYGVLSVTDWIYYPDIWLRLAFLRFLVVIPLFLITILWSYYPSFHKYHQPWIAFNYVMGGMVVAYMLIIQPENIVYYGGLFIIYFSGYLIVQLRFIPATIAGWTIFIFHFLGVLITQTNIGETFYYSSIFLAIANVLGMIGAYHIEKMNRAQFLKNIELNEKSEQLVKGYKDKSHQLERLKKATQDNKRLQVQYQHIQNASNQLTLEKQRFEQFVKQSRTFVYELDLAGKYTYVSESVKNVLGYEPEEMLGTYFYDYFPENMRSFYREAGFEGMHQGLIVNDFVNPLENKFGSVIWVSSYLMPIYDSNHNLIKYQGSDMDITEKKEALNNLEQSQKELQESKNHLQLIMDKMPIGIAVNTVIPEIDFTYMNDRFASIYGINKKDIEPGTFWEKVFEHPKDRDMIKKTVLSAMASGNPKNMVWEDVPIRRKGKKTQYITAYNIPLPNSNQVISTVMDVTERKNKEDQILHLSNHDYLTDIPNRRYFQDMLMKMDNSSHYPLGIMIMDLNGLKIINDAFGHGAGNIALKKVADMLLKIKGADGFIARIGGDEFSLLLPNTSLASLEAISNKIKTATENILVRNLTLSIAIGYTLKKNSEKDIRKSLTEAENQMYKNKVTSSSSMRNDAIKGILQTLQNKYDEEKRHSETVSHYCRRIGEVMQLSEEAIKELEMAGLYHDIGKIAIPDDILKKPDKLTKSEWKVMKEHTTHGYQILRAADRYSNLAEYAMTHHERIDGTGYPNGLSGNQIPLFSRIIAVVDAYEAMTSDRPYRKAISVDLAIKELKQYSGTQFDGDIVNLFVDKVLK